MKYFDFFDRIKLWVKEHNTTIEALLKDATDGSVTKNVYQGWRTRGNLPSGEYCYDIAKFMGVSCDWLISGKEFKKIDPHSSANGTVVADEKEYRENMKAVIANSKSFGSGIKPLLENILKLDDAGITLIADEVSLLLRHSHLQARMQNISSEKMA